MWKIINKTPFAAQLGFLADPNGVDTAIAVIKATFIIGADNTIAVARTRQPIRLADEHWADPATSSIRYSSEIGFVKPNTDTVLLGHAYAPGGEPVRKTHVSLRVGACHSSIKVFGNRFHDHTLGIPAIVGPLPFDKIALTYENAFGGSDTRPGNPPQTLSDPINPVGRGVRIRGGRHGKQTPLPNLEPQTGNAPAGFGYIAPHWQHRARYAGTYDEKWRQKRAPILPADFNPRFFNCAHPDLIANGYLSGGETVAAQNVTVNGSLNFVLPKLTLNAGFIIKGRKTERPCHMDTLIIEPDQNRFCMIWRASAACDKATVKVDGVRIDCRHADLDLKRRADA